MRVVFLAALLASICVGQNSESTLRTDRDLAKALAGGDRSALERLLDADLTWTNFEGVTKNKTDVLRNPPKSLIPNDAAAEIRAYDYGEIGDVQVNLGKAHVLRVWVKRPDAWKLIVYQEVMSLPAPPSFAPGAGKNCENPCKGIPYQPKNETERQVAAAYSKLETAAMAHNAPVFAAVVADEFVAASSNSNKISGKRDRMEDFSHNKNAGVAPTPLTTVRMFPFGDAVLMISSHIPDRGKPLHVTRLWVKQRGNWVEALSYQTSVEAR